MSASPIDVAPLDKAIATLREAIELWLERLRWREWREMRNATSHAYDEAKAQALAQRAGAFAADAISLLAAIRTGSHD